MADPSRRNSRLAIAAGSAALIAVAVTGFSVGRATAPAPPEAPRPAPVVAAPVEAPPPPPAVPRVLGRAELLAAAAAAADAFAAGAPLPGDGETIAGLRFALSLPIGCGGSSGDETTSGWRYDPTAKALRVRAVPARWSPADWTAQGSAEIEAIEGFWIARPWTASEGCPRAAVQEPAPGAIPAPALAVERTLGIAQFFEAGSSRVGRRDGEAFEAVTREAVETLDTSQGFRLRIEGRVTQAPSGQPVICRSAAAGQRPACLISTALDTLAIENIATGETLATWNLSHENAVPSVD